MTLVLINKTGSPKSYLSGAVIVPANGSVSVSATNQFSIETDGDVRFDIVKGEIYVSDGTNIFYGVDALNFLDARAELNAPLFGATDGTGIGNVADALKVAVVSSSGVRVDNTNVYNEVSSVPSATLTTVATYTVPGGKKFVFTVVECSGDNIAEWQVLFSSVVNGKLRTYFGGDLNASFDFSGLEIDTGVTVDVKVIHQRSSLGTFNARIQGDEI